jgi:hypothetical protein
MSHAIALSDSARDILRRRLSGQRVEVTDDTRESYRELAAAGLAEPVHTFRKGRDSHYRLTLAAKQRKTEFFSHRAGLFDRLSVISTEGGT